MTSRSFPAIEPIDAKPRLKNQAYTALKNVIVAMDIYKSRAEIRLDERKLAADLGISRTPVREAISQLEREGFVRSVPRRGVYVARKTQERGDRADRRLGSAREHGGASCHAKRERRGNRRAAGACLSLSKAARSRRNWTNIPR